MCMHITTISIIKVVFDLIIFCFHFQEVENGDKNVFGWISVFIFSENIFPNEPKTENNQISFSVEIKNSFWIK